MAPWTLTGINEKLNRAKENIINLASEIDAFLDAGGDRVLVYQDENATKEFMAAHFRRPIPQRFSVLAGESLYNMRSALDHLAWQLVVANGETPSNRTCFPIYLRNPFEDKESEARYRRCVKGISSAAQTEIVNMQPYKAWEQYRDHSLAILHGMNIIDKHHALVIVTGTARFGGTLYLKSEKGLPLDVRKHVAEDGTERVPIEGLMRPVNMDAKVALHVSFAEFGTATSQPVIDDFCHLLASMSRVRATRPQRPGGGDSLANDRSYLHRRRCVPPRLPATHPQRR